GIVRPVVPGGGVALTGAQVTPCRGIARPPPPKKKTPTCPGFFFILFVFLLINFFVLKTAQK
ncbi:hypothetical protein ACVGWX_00995, partial [Enterobacter hormaechei]